ncbi:hypothetical protein [Paenibacillus alvei]|uniref:Uncharacterized protein n=1 Tax=Paenibacillus alvei TaxID=44250 RepID=A0AAP6ZYF6_PAEAL|nr:hypothetical protein [Paenibacillus alvei]MCY9582343.1 hypothetical protein [Paenibacillus alvei]MCY9587145.1 hypothetical protein [Paenibacillus alvei]NEZ40834.1 hypothetical protein [Paenibacillus alvei]NOJ69647.1 hypothetical protein [Paenibacillus alvei]
MGAELFVWLTAVFGLVAVVCWFLSRLLIFDSTRHDEQFVWLRSVEEDGSNGDEIINR